MATPPNLHSVGEDELLKYFTRIAAEVQTPLIVQDASGYVGASLAVEFQMRLHRELGDRVMFKPEAPPVGPRLSQLMAGTSDRARIFEGTGGLYLIDSYRRGAIGSMPAADLVWAVAALWNALTADDLDRAYRIAGPLAQIVSLQTSLDSYVAIEKHLLVLQGVLTTSVMRDPVGEVLDEHSVQEIERLFGLLRAAVDA
jgi:4-hydroxy-tetrahydrodipicolinate synthase